MKKNIFQAVFVILTGFIFLACSLTSSENLSTLEPTPTPIPGWVEFTAPGVSLWLPDTYQGGDLENDLDLITEQLKTRGAEYEAVAKMIEQNRSAFVIWAFDTVTGASGALTNVNLVKERVLSAVNPDSYVDAVESQLPSDFSITERQKVKLDNYEALRLIIEMGEPDIKEAMYIIKSGNTMWVVTYATGADEFPSRLPTFEQSVNTLRIEP